MGGNVYRNKEIYIKIISWTYRQASIRHILRNRYIARQILNRQADIQAVWQTYRQIHTTECPDTLCPPPQYNWAVQYHKPIYFPFPTSIPDLHADFQINNLIYLLHVSQLKGVSSYDQFNNNNNNLLHVMCFLILDQTHFCEKILLYFWGCYIKMAIKL